MVGWWELVHILNLLHVVCSMNLSMYGGFAGVHKQEPIVIAYRFGGLLHQTIVFFSKTMQHKGHIVCRPIWQKFVVIM
jgi:hypothetical protein